MPRLTTVCSHDEVTRVGKTFHSSTEFSAIGPGWNQTSVRQVPDIIRGCELGSRHTYNIISDCQ